VTLMWHKQRPLWLKTVLVCYREGRRNPNITQTRHNVTSYAPCVACYIPLNRLHILSTDCSQGQSRIILVQGTWDMWRISRLRVQRAIIRSISSHVLRGIREIQDAHRTYGTARHPRFSIAPEFPPYKDHFTGPEKVEVTLQQKLFLTNPVQ
jgi:hypothetical protein